MPTPCPNPRPSIFHPAACACAGTTSAAAAANASTRLCEVVLLRSLPPSIGNRLRGPKSSVYLSRLWLVCRESHQSQGGDPHGIECRRAEGHRRGTEPASDRRRVARRLGRRQARDRGPRRPARPCARSPTARPKTRRPRWTPRATRRPTGRPPRRTSAPRSSTTRSRRWASRSRRPRAPDDARDGQVRRRVEGRAHLRRRVLPLVRRRGAPDRRLLQERRQRREPRPGDAPADRPLLLHHPLELPQRDGHPQDRPRPCRRLHDGGEAGAADAALDARAGEAPRGVRPAGWRPQRDHVQEVR